MSPQEAEKKIAKLSEEEQVIIEQLKESEREQEQLNEELKALELEEKALVEDEAEFVCSIPKHIISPHMPPGSGELTILNNCGQLNSLRSLLQSELLMLPIQPLLKSLKEQMSIMMHFA
jgi:hypothetical protein